MKNNKNPLDFIIYSDIKVKSNLFGTKILFSGTKMGRGYFTYFKPFKNIRIGMTTFDIFL